MSAQFVLLTTFSNATNGGNPAAVVFTNMSLPADTFMDVAHNLNQPITAFLSASPLPSSNNAKTVAFSVRWFTSSRQEIPLCGHGAIAAAKAVFSRDDVGKDIEVLELHTLTRGIMTARKRQRGFIEIELPSANVIEASPVEYARLSALVVRAAEGVDIKHIATGGEGFEQYLMIVLDGKQVNLKELIVNATPLRESGFHTHVFTAEYSGNERFVSRMFAPGYVPGDEDHVCGSAHCLTAPYWYRKFGIASGQEIQAKQVSRRGGDLKLVWDSHRNTLKLSGEVAVLGKGELVIHQ